jgi:flavin reductase (DIM6/NTAB) family NADH-FMN oxidoreductase RutF/rubredoxin
MNFESFFKITYGLYIVSSSSNGKSNGYIANAVFQVTAEPPQLAVACNKDNFTSGIIKSSGKFSVSVLQKDAKPELIGAFGYKSGKDTEKFNDFGFVTTDNGIPVLVEDCVAWFGCEVVQTFDVGTHLIFIGKISDGEMINESGEPLTYSYYREVKKGKAPKNAPTYIAPDKLEKHKNDKKIYVCPSCGYEYNPEVGDPDSGIPPGIAFEDLPVDWVCPVCGMEKADFELKK